MLPDRRVWKGVLILTLIFLPACNEKEIIQKLDPDLRAELKMLTQTSQMDQELLILFKVNEDLTPVHETILENKGVTIEAHIGHLYTAYVPARSIYQLAKLRFVEYIQGPRHWKWEPGDTLRLQQPRPK